MRRALRFTVPILALLAAFAGRPPATRAADEPPSFGESIDVRVVNLEAVVTDRSGNRVTGLKPQDFRLRVDGREVPIEYFNEVRDGNALPPPAAGTGPATPESAQPEAAVQGLTDGPVGTYYLVFIDDYFAIAANRNLVLKSLQKDLGRLGPDDRMAIVAYDGGRLAMLSNWSGSQAGLARALDQAMARKTHGFERRAEGNSHANDQAFSDQTVGGNTPLVSPLAAGDTAILYEQLLARQVQGDVQAAVSTMRAFAAPHGRKVMLLLSGGWPFSIQNYVTGGGVMPTRQVPTGEEIYRPLTNTANLLGYTLYPVDVPGIQGGDGGSAPIPPASGAPALARGGSVTAADSGGGGSSFSFGHVGDQEIKGSLTYLAGETGGKALLNSNRTIALATARDDTRSFYWLGFSPTWQRNDKGHQIELEARRSDLRVRSRTGFLDLSRKAAVSMEVESALLFGNPPGVLPMPMTLGTIVRKHGEVEIPITLGLPVNVMTVVPVNGKYAAKLELRFAASDADGNSSEIPVLPVDLSSDHPPTPGKLVRYATKITLRGKANHLVVAVYDPLSGKIATAEADVKGP
ncbi:MAG TPA: VWA domain-containing protein [Thermoanaerobaculia bacterium]|jgi:VWFA-related protein